MNSEAMSSATHKAMDPTALHLWRDDNSRCGERFGMSRFSVFLLLSDSSAGVRISFLILPIFCLILPKEHNSVHRGTIPS